MLEWIERGGIMMYPILLLSVVGLYIVIQKFLFLRMNAIENHKVLESVKATINKHGLEDSIKLLRSDRRFCVRVFAASLKLAHLPQEEIQTNIAKLTQYEMPKLERHLNILAALITAEPILGLIGTITGLMKVFTSLSGGASTDNIILLSGISEALITTVTGLCITVPFVFLYQILNQKVDHFVLLLEAQINELLEFVQPGDRSSIFR